MSDAVFTKVEYRLGSLLDSIEAGVIALPEIQRPYVWDRNSVKELLDSMYRGFPIGYFLFWKNAQATRTRSIGVDDKQRESDLLVIDGQQRLTSLYAVINNKPVLREDYQEQKIEIAFNPLSQSFAVLDSTIKSNKLFIPNVSDIWSSRAALFDLSESYLRTLQTTMQISQHERQLVQRSLLRLQSIRDYSITALELLPSLRDEQVSEIFLRINNEGRRLTTSDFVRTLVSVFWKEGSAQLEDFTRRSRTPARDGSPYNHLIDPKPDQLLRAAVALAFRRTQMEAVYAILRGKDLKNSQVNPRKREEQFALLKKALLQTLDLANWNGFLKSIRLAGYRTKSQITDTNTLIMTYVLYLIGRTQFRVPELQLRKAIAQCFFATILTGRYIHSETRMEADLGHLSGANRSPENFLSNVSKLCETALRDQWERLPKTLADNIPSNATMQAYFASLIVLDAKALFSKYDVAEFFDPDCKTGNTDLDRHTLFPKGYLRAQGIKGGKELSQNANFAVMEWDHRTFDVGNADPSKYVTAMEGRFNRAEWQAMNQLHALPNNWHTMPYRDFLQARRDLIARVIRQAYEHLASERPDKTSPISLVSIIKNGEGTQLEFKASLRNCTKTGKAMKELEIAVIKAVAGLLNSHGGNLLIGVSDKGKPIGLAVDAFKSEDEMHRHFDQLVRQHISPHAFSYIRPRFEQIEDQRVMVVECDRARQPVYIKEEKEKQKGSPMEFFYIRNGAQTVSLSTVEALEYAKTRFSDTYG